MDSDHLYQQIAETLRRQILSGELKPGDRLPSVRQAAGQWNCTVGTVQRAYQELAQAGLITSRAGQGTRVVDRPPLQGELPLRRAALIHKAEAFLLETLTAGYQLDEIESALRMAMDRWRSLAQEPTPGHQPASPHTLRFNGSHDLVLTWLAAHFPEIAPGYKLSLQFSGSLGGLIALAEGHADLAGSHLWDVESGEYNAPFVRRLLPGKRLALVTLAHRRAGLILPEGNPLGLQGLPDLLRPGLRFANRNEGSGTRVWLDAQLHALGFDSSSIIGYTQGFATHSAVAQAVAEARADVGLGLQAAALAYGLHFIPLLLDRYDLVIPAPALESPPLQALLDWLRTPAARLEIEKLGGYETGETGSIHWVE
jgi:molybdate-binding protein/DNA-binding transcriptional regulator YhcF (GntR family)